jgi:hypothetical protein
MPDMQCKQRVFQESLKSGYRLPARLESQLSNDIDGHLFHVIDSHFKVENAGVSKIPNDYKCPAKAQNMERSRSFNYFCALKS